MDLSQFIAERGDKVCAKKWKIKERTVASWRRCERQPMPAQARKIIKAESGALSMDDIYGKPK